MFACKKTLVVVTGASRGIGRAICMAMGHEIGSESTFILMARTTVDLNDTKKLLQDQFPDKNFNVLINAIDNSAADFSIFEKSFEVTLEGIFLCRLF